MSQWVCFCEKINSFKMIIKRKVGVAMKFGKTIHLKTGILLQFAAVAMFSR